eukprot:365734-Chlamydomonas_euryale.AAC.2
MTSSIRLDERLPSDPNAPPPGINQKSPVASNGTAAPANGKESPRDRSAPHDGLPTVNEQMDGDEGAPLDLQRIQDMCTCDKRFWESIHAPGKVRFWESIHASGKVRCCAGSQLAANWQPAGSHRAGGCRAMLLMSDRVGHAWFLQRSFALVGGCMFADVLASKQDSSGVATVASAASRATRAAMVGRVRLTARESALTLRRGAPRSDCRRRRFGCVDPHTSRTGKRCAARSRP